MIMMMMMIMIIKMQTMMMLTMMMTTTKVMMKRSTKEWMKDLSIPFTANRTRSSVKSHLIHAHHLASQNIFIGNEYFCKYLFTHHHDSQNILSEMNIFANTYLPLITLVYLLILSTLIQHTFLPIIGFWRIFFLE